MRYAGKELRSVFIREGFHLVRGVLPVSLNFPLPYHIVPERRREAIAGAAGGAARQLRASNSQARYLYSLGGTLRVFGGHAF